MFALNLDLRAAVLSEGEIRVLVPLFNIIVSSDSLKTSVNQHEEKMHDGTAECGMLRRQETQGETKTSDLKHSIISKKKKKKRN
jgi:hypothetical protein